MTNTYTVSEVAKSSIEPDCWFILINDKNGGEKVYDITKYLSDHPRGLEIIMEFAGQNADEMFEYMGHSNDTKSKLKNCLIRDLKVDLNSPTEVSAPKTIVFGGGASSIAYTSKFQSLCDVAIANVEFVESSQVDKLVANGAVTLDIRDPDEHAIDHLKNGLHLSRGKLEMCIEKLIPDLNTTILTYCNANNRGALSAYSLKQMGYQNAKYIADGLKGYRAQALSVSTMNL